MYKIALCVARTVDLRVKLVHSEVSKLISFIMHTLPTVDVKQLRHRVKMTQPVFAHTYGIPLGTLRNYEQNRRAPEGAALAYLGLISIDPEYVAKFVAHKRQLNQERIASV